MEQFATAVSRRTPSRTRRAPCTVNELLLEARASLPPRPSPAEALAAQAMGALLIDVRGDDQRRDCGVIPSAILLPRNSLEWRCDPASQWRHPSISSRDLQLILICQQGFQSSLAAATLQRLGHVYATDMDGGFEAWAAAGLPVDYASPSGAADEVSPQAWARGESGPLGDRAIRPDPGLGGSSLGEPAGPPQ